MYAVAAAVVAAAVVVAAAAAAAVRKTGMLLVHWLPVVAAADLFLEHLHLYFLQ